MMSLDDAGRLRHLWRDHDKTRPLRAETSAAGIDDAKGAESVAAGRPAGSPLHRSAVGDRHPQSDPGSRWQDRDHQTGERRILFLIETADGSPVAATVSAMPDQDQ